MSDRNSLIKRIWATATNLDLDNESLHRKLMDWEMKVSLRAMDEIELRQVIDKLIYLRYPKDYQFDKQGMYMWSQMKQAEWTWQRLLRFFVKRYYKTHWNLLSEGERRAVISMQENYKKKQTGESTNKAFS